MNDPSSKHTLPATLRAGRSIGSLLALVTTLLGSACGTGPGSVVAPAPGAGTENSGEGGEHDATPEPDWCAAQRVLRAKCQRCHSAPPEHGAPFPLVSYEDTQVVGARGAQRLTAMEKAVSDDFMPPRFIALEPPVAALSEAEKQTLLDWCAAGAPAGPPEPGCD